MNSPNDRLLHNPNARKLRVALLCAEVPPRPHGGIGIFVVAFAKALAEAGHDVAVLDIGTHKTSVSIPNVHLVHISLPHHRFLRSLRSRIAVKNHLKNFIKQWQPDILEVPDFSGWLPFRLEGVKVVIRLHGSDSLMTPYNAGRPPRRFVVWTERRTLALNPNWIAPSAHILSKTTTCFGMTPQHQAVVFNPLILPAHDPATISADGPAPQTTFSEHAILFVGTLGARKGVFHLAHAIRPMLSKDRNLTMYFAGKDTMTPEGIQASSRIKAILGPSANQCHFFGHLDSSQLSRLYRSARVFVFPSLFESFGLVYLEAIHHGLPVVASNRSAESEFLTDGETALMVNPADHAALRQALERLLADPLLRRTLSQTARKVVLEKCSMQNCTEASVAFYNRVLAH